MKLIQKSLKFKIFFSRYLSNPGQVGAIAPSSRYLGNAIGRIVDNLPQVELLELGPGTGSLTKFLLHHNLKLVEIDPKLSNHLLKTFPGVEVINSCAIDFLKSLDKKYGVIFSIPLINNPVRSKIIKALSDSYDKGKIKWLIIYTYGNKNPLAEIKFKHANRVKKVYLNAPPASIWLYS